MQPVRLSSFRSGIADRRECRVRVSSSLRHMCAAVLPGKIEYFGYDWEAGAWNLLFVLGIFPCLVYVQSPIGGFLASHYAGAQNLAISEQTRLALMKLGVHDFSGLAPRELFTSSAWPTLKGVVSIVVGGFLVGFGTAYAGGCTPVTLSRGLAGL